MKTKYGLVFGLVVLTPPTACNKSVQFAGQSADQKSASLLFQQQFPAATIGTTTTRFKPVYGLVEEQLALKEQPPVTSTLTQATRDLVVDSATQGNDGTAVTESSAISGAGKLDMVVVVDDSSSMSNYQGLLQQGFTNLLSSLKATDWQLVVGTSTTVEPCLRSLSDPTTPTNPTQPIGATTVFAANKPEILTAAEYAADPTGTQKKFAFLVNAGVNTVFDSFQSGAIYSGNERVLYGATRALDYTAQNNDPNAVPLPTVAAGTTPQCQPANWVRPDSAIAIFVVTDEDNCHVSSDVNYHHSSVNDAVNPPPFNYTDSVDGCGAAEYSGTTPAGTPASTTYMPPALIDTLKKMGRTPGTDARFYGIYYRKGDAANLCLVNSNNKFDRSAGSNQGLAYDNLVAQTKGASGSICDANYANTLNTMSQNVARIVVKKQFKLTNVPIDQSLVVAIDGTPTTDYTLTGTTLTLNNPNGNQKNITMTYRHDPTPKFDKLKLSKVPATGTLQVYVGADQLDASKLTYDDATGEIVLVDMPPDDAVVKVQYRDNVVLPTRFDVSKMPMADAPLSVTVAGTATTDYQYDPVAHTLTFTQAPTDGVPVVLSYRMPNDKVTSYPAQALASATPAKSITASDATSHAPLSVTEAGGNLEFDVGDVVDGREVVVTYDYGDSASVLKHSLASLPLPGTVQVHVDDGSPDCINAVTVEGTDVTFTCDAAAIGEVAISYQFIAQAFTTFTLSQALPAGATAKVYVDGQAINDAVQAGQVFTVPAAELKTTSKVLIVVMGIKAA